MHPEISQSLINRYLWFHHRVGHNERVLDERKQSLWKTQRVPAVHTHAGSTEIERCVLCWSQKKLRAQR